MTMLPNEMLPGGGVHVVEVVETVTFVDSPSHHLTLSVDPPVWLVVLRSYTGWALAWATCQPSPILVPFCGQFESPKVNDVISPAEARLAEAEAKAGSFGQLLTIWLVRSTAPCACWVQVYSAVTSTRDKGPPPVSVSPSPS